MDENWQMKTRWTSGVLLFISFALLLFSLTGCASQGGLSCPVLKPEAAPKAWWYARFQVNWPEEIEEPAWSVDLLLAREVVAPVLVQFRNDIILWRFHRRAGRDKAGHRFSFIFYSQPEAARKIYATLQTSPLLGEMKKIGLIVNDSYDDTNEVTRPEIESTSDRSWSLPLQKAWPYFIMGVSESWLDLISQLVVSASHKPSSLDKMLEFYREINLTVEKTWAKEGGHAYLHHLNALFGYVPVDLRKKGPMSF